MEMIGVSCISTSIRALTLSLKCYSVCTDPKNLQQNLLDATSCRLRTRDSKNDKITLLGTLQRCKGGVKDRLCIMSQVEVGWEA